MAISLDEIKFDLDLSDKLKDVPKDKRSEAKQAAADFLRDAIFQDTSVGRSSVNGAKWKGLSKKYKKFKQKQGKGGLADLDFDSEMLNSLIVRKSAKGVTTEIKRGGEIPKAYNHITGDTLPKRQFMPDEGETWRKGILDGITSVISEFIDAD